jgi:hypothetical protein
MGPKITVVWGQMFLDTGFADADSSGEINLSQ